MYEGSANGASNRRSIYVVIARNNIDPFLRAFDFPDPTTTMGARNTTNVPAQSLTLLNNEQVISRARLFADSVFSNADLSTDTDKINNMFLRALGRNATTEEVAASRQYLEALIRDIEEQEAEIVKLNEFLDTASKQRESILAPIRQRLTEAAMKDNNKRAPTCAWVRGGEEGLTDQINGLKLDLINGAHIADGALILKSPRAFARSGKVSKDVSEKTLAAVVQLDNLDQQGGGVINIQSSNGIIFDAIVYGERDSRLWMPGSNGFVRTQRVN